MTFSSELRFRLLGQGSAQLRVNGMSAARCSVRQRSGEPVNLMMVTLERKPGAAALCSVRGHGGDAEGACAG